MKGKCIDCGAPTGGQRCRSCFDVFQKERADTSARDAEVLKVYEEAGSSYKASRRLGISATMVMNHVHRARSRMPARG